MPIDTDEKEIRSVIDDYFNGMYHSDAEKLGRAFHSGGRITGYDEGKLIDNPISGFIQFVAGVTPPAEEGEAYEMDVVSIDITGDMAIAKVTDLYKGLRLTDYLTFLRIEGVWKIVNKIFHHLRR